MQRGDFVTKICEIVTKFSYLIAKCDWIFSLILSPVKRMPNNANLYCKVCKKTPSSVVPNTPPTTSTSLQGLATAADSGSDSSKDSEAEDSVDADVMVTNVVKCDINKQAPLANLTTSDYQIILNPTGWLTSDIVHKALVLLHKENQSIEGFQCPTLGPVHNFDVQCSVW